MYIVTYTHNPLSYSPDLLSGSRFRSVAIQRSTALARDDDVSNVSQAEPSELAYTFD